METLGRGEWANFCFSRASLIPFRSCCLLMSPEGQEWSVRREQHCAPDLPAMESLLLTRRGACQWGAQHCVGWYAHKALITHQFAPVLITGSNFGGRRPSAQHHPSSPTVPANGTFWTCESWVTSTSWLTTWINAFLDSQVELLLNLFLSALWSWLGCSRKLIKYALWLCRELNVQANTMAISPVPRYIDIERERLLRNYVFMLVYVNICLKKTY